MKKIIFMLINMNVGGTEKALLNLISELDQDDYEVTILMLERYGDFLPYIPKHVQVEYVNDYQNIKQEYENPPKEVVSSYLKKGKVLQAISLLSIYLLSKIKKDRRPFLNYLLRNEPVREKSYDIAVAYAGPMDLISNFVLTKINAKKKIQWIHFDVTKIGFNAAVESKLYEKFNRIYTVSIEGREKLTKMIPRITGKTEVFRNVISPEMIIKQAKEGVGFTDQYEGIRILTVGRLTGEKGQDLAIKALRLLVDNGYLVRWYCLGEGNSRGKYESLVKQNGLEDHFVFLGSNPNPYPYMDQCDIYVQPSRHEGFCITLAEAKCLRKPIVTTNFTGAKEQIRDQETGLIVDVCDVQIFKAIRTLIKTPHLGKTFSTNINNDFIDNEEPMKHLI
ncbi:glycosyltransferase [Bacillus suaedae]|uniref:Glycosyltransferase n=1 Tax=Halalkalibacter suaedae TaxID=2822140 RepID=A0A940WSK4_9BACI|nr:glycosyltransferase [Bacillus suaedae]MBP3951511.1 glycosyltransferase [Bacillus suaedae]